jgi:hypothetical protein
MNIDEVEKGDYVTYTTYGTDGIASWKEEGGGYVTAVVNSIAHIKNGERNIIAHVDNCEMRAKQYRLEV